MNVYTIIIYILCICLSFMSYPCTSHQANNNEQGDKVEEVTIPSFLPRKLKVKEEAIVKDSRKKDVVFEALLFNKKDVASPGNVEAKETQKKMDEAKEAEYFTIMDYKHFKKRRPIHNKSQPSSAVSP